TVNTFANLAGLTMLDDEEYIEKTEKWILEEIEFVYKKLNKFVNVKIYKTECNFILIKLFNISSTSLRDKMIEKNILIRDASNFKFLDDSFIRLAIKDRKSNLKMLEILSVIVEERME
ncbi:MAG: threonine-phosphate decarboxylase, partial [Fusobacterium sp.]|nr:threonine-phosphate decarboxylase [Fusobacterium sp.]